MVRAHDELPTKLLDFSELLASDDARVVRLMVPLTDRIIHGDLEKIATMVAVATEKRGWGRGLRKAVAGALRTVPVKEINARMHEHLIPGWTTQGLIRMSHAGSKNQHRGECYRNAVHGRGNTV